MEGFFNALTTEMDSVENATLFKRIDYYYDQHPEQEHLRRAAHQLRKEFNHIHDTVKITSAGVTYLSVTEETFIVYYAGMVYIISEATGINADNKTLELLGVLKDNLLYGLNVQQKDAVLSNSRIVYVNAGPGTGKTKLLVSKLVHYINNAEGTPRIVALSYTNTASGELATRFREESIKAGINVPCDLYTGTIHSFCLSLMRGYFKSINKTFSYSLISDEELLDLIPDIQHNLGNRYSSEELAKFLSARNKISIPSEVLASVEEMKRVHGLLLVSDILNLFISYLNNDKAFVLWVVDRVDFIVVDEAQDLSKSNYEIFGVLLQNKPSLKMFFVGDPRQNIFAFNGGSFEHLNAFLSQYGADVDEKTLTETYRCPIKVAAFVNSIKFSDCDILPISCNSSKEGELLISARKDEQDEATYVLDKVLSYGSLEDSVVISPTIKGLSQIISLLNERRIPFKVYGGSKRLKKHIRILNHMLRIVTVNNEKSIKIVAKSLGVDVITQPMGAPRNFSPKELFVRTTLGRQFRRLSNDYKDGTLSVEELLSVLYNELFPKEMLQDSECKSDVRRISNMISGYSSVQEYLAAFSLDKERFSSFYEKAYADCESESGETCLVLSTIHSSKGLQWKHVFIIGLHDDAFPGLSRTRFLTTESRDKYINTKLKELYVACTRASDSLEMTYPLVANGKQAFPSSLLEN